MDINSTLQSIAASAVALQDYVDDLAEEDARELQRIDMNLIDMLDEAVG